jgi:hypothetical protein
MRAVVVCTDKRGVFFGYVGDEITNEHLLSGPIHDLERARMVLWWSKDMNGVMGLASKGPSRDCRLSEEADITVRDLHAVFNVTPEALEKWVGW